MQSSHYCGEHSHGMMHGFGDFTCVDGTRYIGHWNKGEREGTGCEYLPHEDSWTYGIWKHDEKIKDLEPSEIYDSVYEMQ